MLSSLYVAGDSPLHRARVGPKLLAVLVLAAVLSIWRDPVVTGVLAAVVTVAALVAGLGPRWLGRQVWGLRWVVLLLGVVQVWSLGVWPAVVLVGGLVVAIVGAGVVTATTRVSDMMDAVVAGLGPARRLGVDPERVALALGLTVATIPVLAGIMTEVGQARAARGLQRSPRALLVPVVVRAVTHAQAVGDALVARGVDD